MAYCCCTGNCCGLFKVLGPAELVRTLGLTVLVCGLVSFLELGFWRRSSTPSPLDETLEPSIPANTSRDEEHTHTCKDGGPNTPSSRQ